MALSPQQKRLVQLLSEGYTLRIVRSLINHAPVHAELFCPGNSCVETVQWGRIDKMLRARCVRLDTGNVANATQIVAPGPAALDRSEPGGIGYSLTAPVMPDT